MTRRSGVVPRTGPDTKRNCGDQRFPGRVGGHQADQPAPTFWFGRRQTAFPAPRSPIHHPPREKGEDPLWSLWRDTITSCVARDSILIDVIDPDDLDCNAIFLPNTPWTMERAPM